jgi:hypothetical protein
MLTMEAWKGTHARPRITEISVTAIFALLCFLIVFSPASAAAATPKVAVSPPAGIVGSSITINGSGFPPNTTIVLGWTSENASWQIQAIPTPQVTAIKSSPLLYKLGSTQSDASGSFSMQIVVPSDYGGSHAIQAYATNGTAISPVAGFTVIPHFQVSPSSGPAGTPVNVVATGLGIGIYSTSYHLYWDNSYVGYITAVSTGGATNFTFYTSGVPGRHAIAIWEGYPGPGVFNPCQEEVGSILASSVCWPPDVPFFANFTITPENVAPGSVTSTSGAAFITHHAGEVGAFSLLAAALVGGGFFVATRERDERKAISKALVGIVIIALVAVGGIGLFLTTGQNNTTDSTSSTTNGSSGPNVTFSPVAIVDRPQIIVPMNNVTAGPRISVTPTLATVGANVTVNGQGFAPSAQLHLTYSTRKGSNIIGYKLINEPLRNVTAGTDGSFSFTMKVRPDLGGVHYIAAGNLTENSNGTLFIERTARLSATQGPEGTQFLIILQGVGWDFNTNIATWDYDNSYVGYGCGFSSGGNVTFTVQATGAPGIHTIDIYPSVWWGPENFANQLAVEYRYPLLTPQDHPELIPSFHFTFLITSG